MSEPNQDDAGGAGPDAEGAEGDAPSQNAPGTAWPDDSAGAPPATPPAPPAPPAAPKRSPAEAIWAYVRDYFVGEDPTFWVAMVPMLIVAGILYTRHPHTNFIFDEQEALLANPYVNGKAGGWLAAFQRDFWGLPPDRSVGSYRPIRISCGAASGRSRRTPGSRTGSTCSCTRPTARSWSC